MFPGLPGPSSRSRFRVTYDPSPPHIFSCQSGRTRSAGGGVVRRTPGSLPWLRSRPALRFTRTYPRRVLSGHLTAPLPRPVTCPPDFHSRCISESAAMVPTAYGVTSCIPASLSQFLTSRPLRRRGRDCLVGAGAAGVGPWDPVPASSQRPGALAWPLCGGRMLRFPSVHATPPAPRCPASPSMDGLG